MHFTSQKRTRVHRTHKKCVQAFRGLLIAQNDTYVIVGSGEPPILLHVSSCFIPSVAIALIPGATSGGCGGVKTVKL